MAKLSRFIEFPLATCSLAVVDPCGFLIVELQTFGGQEGVLMNHRIRHGNPLSLVVVVHTYLSFCIRCFVNEVEGVSNI